MDRVLLLPTSSPYTLILRKRKLLEAPAAFPHSVLDYPTPTASILHNTRDLQLYILIKTTADPQCSLGRARHADVFSVQPQGCGSSRSWLREWPFWKVPALGIAPKPHEHKECSHPSHPFEERFCQSHLFSEAA